MYITTPRSDLLAAMNEPWQVRSPALICSEVVRAMHAHRWDLAHAIVVKAVPLLERSSFMMSVKTGLMDVLAVRMVPVLLGKAMADRREEVFPRSRMNQVTYFESLRTHYARFVALTAVEDLEDVSEAQRIDWLHEAMVLGLGATGADFQRVLALEAARFAALPLGVWDALNEHGLLSAHRTQVLAALREHGWLSAAYVEALFDTPEQAAARDARREASYRRNLDERRGTQNFDDRRMTV